MLVLSRRPAEKMVFPGQWVRWRNPEHARSLWWDETYGPGPFEVLGVVDHTPDDIPQGLLLQTRLGEREVNTVWLAPEVEPDWQGYDLETLTVLLDG